jgi:cytoskeletal protein RodZ
MRCVEIEVYVYVHETYATNTNKMSGSASAASAAAANAAPLVQVTTTGGHSMKESFRPKMNWITLGISVLVGLGVFVCISMVLNLKKKVIELENRDAIDELVLANTVRRQVVATFEDFRRAQVRAATQSESQQSHDATVAVATDGAATVDSEEAATDAAVAAAATDAAAAAVDADAVAAVVATDEAAAEATSTEEPVIAIVPPTKPVTAKRGPGRPKAPASAKDD